MLYGLMYGLVVLCAFAYYLTTGETFYDTEASMQGPLGFYYAAFLVMATAITLFGYRSFRISQSKKWPQVTGTVSEVEILPAGWRLTYLYRVNDTPYQHDHFSVNSPLASPVDIATQITKTPTVSREDLIGRRVKVFYNPALIHLSVLSREGEPSEWMLIIPAAVSLGACGLMTFIMLSALG